MISAYQIRDSRGFGRLFHKYICLLLSVALPDERGKGSLFPAHRIFSIRWLLQQKLYKQVLWIAILFFAAAMLVMLTFFGLVEKSSRQSRYQAVYDSVEQITNVVTQHCRNMENYVTRLAYHEVISTFMDSQTLGKRYTNGSRIRSLVTAFTETNQNISEIIYTNGKDLFISNDVPGTVYLVRSVMDQMTSETALHLPGEMRYFRVFNENDEQYYYAIVASSMRDPLYGNQPMILILVMQRQPVWDLMTTFASETAAFLLLDSEDRLIASSSPASGFFGSPEELDAICRADESGRAPGQYVIYREKCKSSGWKVIGITKKSVPLRLPALTTVLIIAPIAIMLLMMSVFVIIVNRNVINPVLEITHFARNLKDGSGHARLACRQKNEIGEMAAAINGMLDNIQDLNEKVLASEQRLHQAELANQKMHYAALTSQINPHFLYNTMDCICGIALKEGIPSIANMTASISRIFRYSIRANNFVLLEDELKCISDYMYIVKVRHNNRILLDDQVPSEMRKLSVPKMILQPLVENAVFHGLEMSKGKGTIWIRGERCGQGSSFSVQDNGIGMTEEKLQKIRHVLNGDILQEREAAGDQNSIGIINIFHRLKLLYQENVSMTINSTPGLGTTVTIRFDELRTDLVDQALPMGAKSKSQESFSPELDEKG